jgi:hypothetical protein
MSELRGQSVFNTSQLNLRKNNRKKERKIVKEKEVLSIVLLEKELLIKDVMPYISKLLVKNRTLSSSTSFTNSSSHIRDPNNFNNFNKKKIIEIIRNKTSNPYLRYDPMFLAENNHRMVSEIQNMNELIIPKNPGDFTNVQVLISQYYRISITHDILELRSFTQTLSSSRFNIIKSDKKFFIYPNEDGIYNNLNNPKIHNMYESIFNGNDFLKILYLQNRISDYNSFTKSLILIVRHIHFKDILKEILYMNNNYKQYNVHHVNDMRNEISNNIYLRREKRYIGFGEEDEEHPIKIQQLFNTVEKIFNKTFDKIIKELK